MARMIEDQSEFDDILSEIIWYTKQTYEKLKDWGVDVLGLYSFYYYTAKRQKTNQVKASVGYCAVGIWISEDRIRKARKTLMDMWLIEDVKIKWEWWWIEWRYVRVKYISSTLPKTHPLESPQCGNPNPNAWSNNILNAWSNNNKMLREKTKEKVATLPLQERLKEYRDVYTTWMLYEFELYRTEANDKWKQRREFEKVFDLSKRLRTWKMRQDKFSKPKYESSIDRDKRVQQQVQTQRDLSPKYTGNAMNNLQEQVSRREQGEGSWGDDR